MSDDEINVAVADAMGWRKEDGVYVWTANGIDCTCDELWGWANDLNAMHLAEKMLSVDQIAMYFWRLCDASKKDNPFMAIARERAEAFLRTLGKWEEAQP